MRFPPLHSGIQVIALLRPVAYLYTVRWRDALQSKATFYKPSQASHRAQSAVAGSNAALSAMTTGDFGTKSQAVQKERAEPGARRTRMKLSATHYVMMGRLLGGLLVATMPVLAIADAPIASSSFVGAEDPLFENGAWAALTSLSPNGARFQKNNGAYPDKLYQANDHEHAGARTTAVIPADHYSEIVVGHVGSNMTINNCCNNVGPIVRVQSSGPAIDSHYLWWASRSDGVTSVNILYRIDANGTTYTAHELT